MKEVEPPAPENELPPEPRLSLLHHLRERRIVTVDAAVEYLKQKRGVASAIGTILMHKVRREIDITYSDKSPAQITLPGAEPAITIPEATLPLEDRLPAQQSS